MCECVFCKIIEKKLPSYPIFENENVIAILDIDPINEGHVLVIPKKHVNAIDELPTEMFMEAMVLAQKIVKALKECYHADGYSIMQNGGQFCDFGHCHIHIFPRYVNDGFSWNYSDEEFKCSEEIAEKIKKLLGE